MSFSRLLAIMSMGIGSILPHWDRMVQHATKESLRRTRTPNGTTGDGMVAQRYGWHPSMAARTRSGGSLAKHRAKVRARTGRK